MKGSSRSKFKPVEARQPQYSKEEFSQRGAVLYESQVRSQVEAGNHGKLVAINSDIHCGTVRAACLVAKLLSRREFQIQPFDASW